MDKNFYQILNISENATLADIKKAYRKLALQFHPDKNKDKDAQNKFIAINIAYETLKDFNSRTEYDNFIKSEKENSEREFKNYSNKKYKQKAEEYASMSYEQFENILENIIIVGKKIKKTANMGCGWILAIIFFPLSIISFFAIIINGNFAAIPLPFVLFLFGLGGYAMAKGE
jgi:DnaJ-class molecular chaperone